MKWILIPVLLASAAIMFLMAQYDMPLEKAALRVGGTTFALGSLILGLFHKLPKGKKKDVQMDIVQPKAPKLPKQQPTGTPHALPPSVQIVEIGGQRFIMQPLEG